MLNSIYRERLALLDRQPMPEGRFVFTPTAASVLISRACPVVCKHCASSSTPGDDQVLPKERVDRFLLGLECLPIQTVAVGGGEPFLKGDLLADTLDLARILRGVKSISVSTSGCWAKSDELTDSVLSDFSFLDPLVLAINLDIFHQAVPLENLVRIAKKFLRHFPEGKLVVTNCRFPEDQTTARFVDLLRAQGFIVKGTTKEYGGEVLYKSISIWRSGIDRIDLNVQTDFPSLVGRGRNLRTDEYLNWRTGLIGGLNLHEGQSGIFGNSQSGWHILSLGWDLGVYPSCMFAETGTLPIGDGAFEAPAEIIERAQRDPILRTLIISGVGAIYQAAVAVDPAVETLVDPRLCVEEILFDVLASPERTLAMTQYLIDKREGRITLVSADLSLQAALSQLFTRNCIGVEHERALEAAKRLAGASLQEAVAAFISCDFGDSASLIYFTTAMKILDTEQRIRWLTVLIENDTVFAKVYARENKSGVSQPNSLARRQFYRALLTHDISALHNLLMRAPQERAVEDAIIECAVEIPQLDLIAKFAELFLSLSQEDRNALLALYHLDQKVTNSLVTELLQSCLWEISRLVEVPDSEVSQWLEEIRSDNNDWVTIEQWDEQFNDNGE